MSANDAIYFLHSLSPDTNRRAVDFFDAVAHEVCGNTSLKDQLQIIVVVHAYENVLPFLQSLDKIFTVAGVIFKNSTGSMRPEYAEYAASKGFKVLKINKSDFTNSDNKERAHKEIEACLDPSKNTIIMDHGGYFAFSEGDFLQQEAFPPDKVLAVTEYAANGQERWENATLDRPVISIGRSSIKIPSDICSARSIVDASITFAQCHNVPLTDKRTSIGVIGHGRLGKGIVDRLSENPAHVSVYEIDEINMTGLRHASVVNKKKILQNSDIVFCATGKRAILPGDFKHLKDGVIIFTVTSPDDELNLGALIKEGVLIPAEVRGQAYAYTVGGTEKKIWLPFNGEAPNSCFSSSVNDPTILMPYALQIVSTIKAFQHLEYYSPNVHEAEPRYENLVARVWNRHFNPAACEHH